MDESWLEAIGDELETPSMQALRAFLASEIDAGRGFYPPGRLVFNALRLTPSSSTRRRCSRPRCSSRPATPHQPRDQREEAAADRPDRPARAAHDARAPGPRAARPARDCALPPTPLTEGNRALHPPSALGRRHDAGGPVLLQGTAADPRASRAACRAGSTCSAIASCWACSHGRHRHRHPDDREGRTRGVRPADRRGARSQALRQHRRHRPRRRRRPGPGGVGRVRP